MTAPDLPAGLLPAGIAVRRVETPSGLAMRVLEAGAGADRPLALLLHGFPELAFSWRRIIPTLAAAGFHVVAPDQRGYGATTGGETAFAGADLSACAPPALVRDALALLHALGRPRAEAVIGHDFGAVVAAWAALIRPDAFGAVAMMSAPFGGPPGWDAARGLAARDIHDALAALPSPRLHYQRYYSGPEADPDMRTAPQGLHAFLRAYFHVKSGDWPGNAPRPLPAWTAEALAALPAYYVMQAGRTMPATVAPEMPDGPCAWLTDAELAVYADAYAATGFQGALNWYRAGTDPAQTAALRLFAGRRIEVPAAFIAGAKDWGIHQKPGDFERMQGAACADLRAVHLVPGAGHWVQQEASEAVAAHLLGFLRDL